MSLGPILEHAEVLCRQFGSCSSLPEDLRGLVHQPVPPRLSAVSEEEGEKGGEEEEREEEKEVVVCRPDSHSVPDVDVCQEPEVV